jgi:Ca2+-transporting ATPase
MNRPPRNPAESVFSRGLSRKIISRGIQIGVSTVFVFALVFFTQHDLALARTMAFSTLVFCQLFHVYDCRSEMLTIFELGFFSNKYLLLATCCSALMQLAVIYLPFMQDIFATVPLSLSNWAIVLTVSGWTFFIGALKHIFFRRRLSGRSVLSRI